MAVDRTIRYVHLAKQSEETISKAKFYSVKFEDKTWLHIV